MRSIAAAVAALRVRGQTRKASTDYGRSVVLLDRVHRFPVEAVGRRTN